MAKEAVSIDTDKIKAHVDPIAKEWTDYVSEFRKMTIVDKDMADIVGGTLQDISKEIKRLEDKRKEVVSPLNQVVKTVNSWFKPAVDALEEAKGILKKKMAEYIARTESDKENALAVGDVERALAVPNVTPEGITTRMVWTYEVTDPDIVPRNYLTVDYAKISNLVATADPEKIRIPGVKVYQMKTVVMKRS